MQLEEYPHPEFPERFLFSIRKNVNSIHLVEYRWQNNAGKYTISTQHKKGAEIP